MRFLTVAAAAVCFAGFGAEFELNALFETARKNRPTDAGPDLTTYCEKAFVPEEMKGERIFIEIPVPTHTVDTLVKVNGEAAGEALRPGGTVEITRFAKAGATNEFELTLTKSGEGTSRGKTHCNQRTQYITPRGLSAAPRVFSKKGAYITDVFANTSVRQGRLTVETEVDSPNECDGKLTASVKDLNGNEVKRIETAVKLKKGLNLLKPGVEWKDPHYWAFGDGYLYTCEVKLEAGGAEDEYGKFRFGFREIWRDGKELYMNGHPLHMRVCYNFAVKNEKGMNFIKDVGYQVLAFSHQYSGFPAMRKEVVEMADRMGMGLIISCGALLNITKDTLGSDKAEQELYRTYMKGFHRKYRNHPSLVAAYVSQMIICSTEDFPPPLFGQRVGTSPRDEAINMARDINHEHNPNILYYSHADGSNGDLSSANLYFNWTPQQEIDEWPSIWAREGKYPWHGAEFDAPYGGCWWFGGGYSRTEHYARYYGEVAYGKEVNANLDATRDLSGKMRSLHGGSAPKYFDTMADDALYYPRFYRDIVAGVQKHWRAYGINGGLIWFNLHQNFGGPVDKLGQTSRGDTNRFDMDDFDYTAGLKPWWANESWDYFKKYTQDWMAFIAGAPEIADKTHAYYAGEEVEKKIAAVWDGNAEKTVGWKWTAAFAKGGKKIAEGEFEGTFKPGEIRHEAVKFTAPEVKEKTAVKMRLVCFDGSEDEFMLEVYPRKGTALENKLAAVAKGKKIALLDPEGKTGPVLDALGIKYEKAEDEAGLKGADFAIIGKDALTKKNMGVTKEELAGGKRVLVMAQTPATWKNLGFLVQDYMARKAFVREKSGAMLRHLEPEMLDHWRGTPDYGKEYVRIMQHAAPHAPQGTRRHTIAGMMIEKPQTAGFTAMVDMGWDLNYSALLRFDSGKGSVTFCTFDFENRMGVDPAATETARAVFGEFLGQKAAKARSAVSVAGKEAAELAGELMVATAADGGIVLAGGDADAAEVMAKAKGGARVLAFNNPAVAKAAGFALEERQTMRTTGEGWDELGDVSPALLRWRDPVKYAAMTGNADARAKTAGDGMWGTVPVGEKGGSVSVLAIDPKQLAERYAKMPAKEEMAADSEWKLGLLKKHIEKMSADGGKALQPGSAWWDGEGSKMVKEMGMKVKGGQPLMVFGGAHKNVTKKYVESLLEQGREVMVVAGWRLMRAFGIELRERELLGSVDAGAFGVEMEGRKFAADASVCRAEWAPRGWEIKAGGLVAELKAGKGRLTFFGVDPYEWAGMDDEKGFGRLMDSNEISRMRTVQLFAQVLNRMGAEPDAKLSERMTWVAPDATLKPLPAAHVLGPFASGKDTRDQIDRVWDEQAEAMAKAGDYNPNIDFKFPDGTVANWRPVVAPDALGKFNLKPMNPKLHFPVCYMICVVRRQKAGEATLKVGSDWRTVVWCNGEKVFETDFGAGYPKYEVKLQLKEGDNVISFKQGSGINAYFLQALLSGEPDPDGAKREERKDLEAVKLYAPRRELRDPYTYYYW